MTTLTSVSGSPSQRFPSFMSFDLDPQQGPNLSIWWIKPYRDWGLEEEAAKTVLTNTAVGSAVGGGLGAAGNLLGLFESFKKLKDFANAVMAGSLAGGVVGAIRGIYVTQHFFLARASVVRASTESCEKAKLILQAFVNLNNEEDEDILCPITRDIMVYPVRTSCNHAFEYFRILEWLTNSPKVTRSPPECPICQQVTYVRNLTFDRQKEREIHEKVALIFHKMEAILQRFPKRFLGCDILPNLSDTDQITAIAAKIEQGGELLKGDVKAIAQKIQEETLSDEEAVGLAYFLIHQMQPLKEKIEQVYKIAEKHLMDSRDNNTISLPTYMNQHRQLFDWYHNFNIVPQECKILRKLYKM